MCMNAYTLRVTVCVYLCVCVCVCVCVCACALLHACVHACMRILCANTRQGACSYAHVSSGRPACLKLCHAPLQALKQWGKAVKKVACHNAMLVKANPAAFDASAALAAEAEAGWVVLQILACAQGEVHG